MKFSSAIILTATSSLLLAACSSLDNPFANLFHTGRDARVYNPQTGQYEWPNSTPKPGTQKSAAVASALGGQQSESDGRYFDPQKNEWVEVRKQTSSSSKPKATPEPGSAEANAAAVSAAPQPPPPRPPRDSGVYNAATGRIEWQSSGGRVPPSGPPGVQVAQAAPKAKHWWWPF